MLKKIIKDWFTENDGESFDPVRLVAIIGGFEFLGIAGYQAITNPAFDFMSFGGGLGAVITAMGLAIAAKSATEKKP